MRISGWVCAFISFNQSAFMVQVENAKYKGKGSKHNGFHYFVYFPSFL